MRAWPVLLVSVGVLGVLGPARSAAGGVPRPWVLYASDWAGPTEIYAADLSGGSSVRQVTFGRSPEGCRWAAACGFSDPMPSSDGRRLAFWSAGLPSQPRTLWLAKIDGSGRREVAATATAAEWTPGSKLLVYRNADGGVHAVTPSGVDRLLRHWPAPSLPWQAWGPGVLGTAWSRDERRVAYATRAGIFVVAAKGGRPRRVYAFAPADLSPVPPQPVELAFSPNGRLLAVTLPSALAILDLRTDARRVVPGGAHDLAWSADGRQLLYVQRSDSSDGDSISTGDVRTVAPNGHIRVIVSRSAQFGGQIVSAAWVVPPRVSFKPPAPLDGVFAGGPVQKLAADGDRVAFAACGGVSVWDATSSATTAVQPTGACEAPFSRSGHVGMVALADDRALWWWSSYIGLGFGWSIYETTLGAAPIEVASGFGDLGSTPGDGSGTAIGASSLLVMSRWSLGGGGVEQQTIERVDPGGCPCTAISTNTGPYTPLDVDQGRIVVSSATDTRMLAADGTILFSLPIPTQAAQLDGSQLVLAAGNQLDVYDAQTAVLRATWTLPAAPVGHDCDLFTDPDCNYGRPTAPLTLEDVSRGLAAYSYAGRIHLLRLDDGADQIVGDGTLARFTNAGLAYADGARIRLLPLTPRP